MIKGKTSSGFEYEILEEQLNNYELLESIAELDENTLALPKVVNMLLGKEQKNKLAKHLRNKDGIVPMDKMMGEVTEIFQSKSEIKN